MFSAFRRNYDKKTFWTQAVVGCNLVKGPILLVLIGAFLTPEMQGYWFAFISIGAFVYVADLGFTVLITQYISHQSASLEIYTGQFRNILICRNELLAISRLVCTSLVIYVVIIAVVALFLGIFGAFYFSEQTLVLPWLVYVFASALFLIVTVLQAVILGFDEVVSVNKDKTVVSIGIAISTSIFLLSGLGLWALPFGLLAGSLLSALLHLKRYMPVWVILIKMGFERMDIGCLNGIGRLQAKYTISWICGYFIFQLYVPVILKVHGPVEAGKVGLMIAIFTALSQISNGFVVSQLPLIGRLSGAGREKEALHVFEGAFLKRTIGYVLISTFSMVIISISTYIPHLEFLKSKLPFFELLVLVSFLFLFVGAVSNLAAYIRAHREEEFMYFSILNALIVSAYMWFFKANIYLLFTSIVITYLFVLTPMAFFLYFRKRAQYLVG